MIDRLEQNVVVVAGAATETQAIGWRHITNGAIYGHKGTRQESQQNDAHKQTYSLWQRSEQSDRPQLTVGKTGDTYSGSSTVEEPWPMAWDSAPSTGCASAGKMLDQAKIG